MSTRVLHEISSLQFYSDQKTNNFKRLRSASLPRTAFRAPYSLAPAHSARYDSLWVAQSTAVSALVRFALASSFWLSFCRVQLSVDGFSWFCWVWWTRCVTLPLETGSHSTRFFRFHPTAFSAMFSTSLRGSSSADLKVASPVHPTRASIPHSAIWLTTAFRRRTLAPLLPLWPSRIIPMPIPDRMHPVSAKGASNLFKIQILLFS